MKMKKSIAAALSVLMILCSIPLAAAAESSGYATRGEVLDMLMTAADDYNPGVKESDIMQGDENGLRENDSVTRAEALIMLGRAFGGFPELTGNNLRIAIPKEDFTDIPAWAEAELEPVFNAGLAAGTGDGKFSPDEYVTTEQMQTFIRRVFALCGSNLKDSYYSTVNKTQLDSLTIPEGRTSNGVLSQVSENTLEQTREIIQDAATGSPEPGSAQEKIKILYNNIMDMDARNAAGYEPIREDLEAVASAGSISDLCSIRIFNDTSNASELLARFSLSIDPMDSTSYIGTFVPATPLLSQQIYNGEDEAGKTAYIKYLKTLLTLCGEADAEAEANANAFFEFEKEISQASLSLAEQYDISNTYNIYTLSELKAMFPLFNMDEMFEAAGLKDSSEILVSDAKKLERTAQMFTDDNFENVQNYVKLTLILNCASTLSEDFVEAENTYNNEVLGISGSASDEDTAVSIVSNLLSEYIGQAYAEKYCTDEIVNDVTEIIHEVIDVYKDRIANLDWMSETTKEKALLKLETMVINVGAPDYEDYDFALETAVLKSAEDGGSFFDNIMEIRKANLAYMAKSAGTKIDKTEWITTPHTVNAFYSANFNSINFPIAFLQAPIYDSNASYEENLGAVGMVIGHEITHAFDSSGSQYDENGNAVNWWTDKDAATFAALCDNVVEYYRGLEPAPGITVNPEQTLTENIADLGGMSCITEIGSRREGFDFKKMFESYANLWLSVNTREYMQMKVNSDVHSPDNIRVDRVLQSIDKFYEVYDIAPGDGMYVAPENRAKIW